MKHILWICWVVIALPFQTFAQEEERLTLNDTLIIKMSGKNQIRVIGVSMLNIVAYTRADSLKTIFLSDLRKAIGNSESKQLPLKVYYLVHESGKRRMKIKTEEYVDETFDLRQETYHLDEDLPKHELNVYDLKSGILMQFFVSDSIGIQDISEFNIMDGISYALANKKEAKRYYRYDIKQQMGGFALVSKKRNHISSIEISPYVGVTMMGNFFTPILGGDISLRYCNKYSVESFRTGLRMKEYFFPEFDSTRWISGVTASTGIDLYFMYNINQRSRHPYFMGLEYGTPTMLALFVKEHTNIYLARHFGMLVEYKGLQYSFGVMRFNANNVMPMVGIKLPF